MAASATYPIGFVVATAGAFVLVARRLAPARAAFSLAALWATAFAVAFALATLGWNDADGFVDCNDFCSTTQTAVGFTLFLSPPLVFGLLVLGMVLHARGRRRAR